ncbi:MAG TPA: fibronectin type III domain-containing protein, partial [Methylomirabilota bacterium]|nr:fibronectin type III domain-containing protein [Methylomirabilota bacterium]
VGNPVALSRSSYVVQYNRERNVGAHLGIAAKALDSVFTDISASGGNTTAIVTWNTASNGTSQVEYGLTPAYGTLSALDLTPVTNHSVTLNGLAPGTRYYYRVRSQLSGTEYVSSCGFSSFTTTNVGVSLRFGLTNNWKYSTTNYNGVNWQIPAFDDSGWASGPGVMFADSRAQSPNAATIPHYATGTRMPINPGTTYPYGTYYFRTYFVFSNSPAGVTLIFSNYIDDGAVFYLNGVELFRTNLPAPPNVIVNSTLATAASCGSGDANCPLVFTLGGALVASSLVTGTNVVAVEVHNFNPSSPDITFESALFSMLPPDPPPFVTNIVVVPGETNAMVSWVTAANSSSQVQYGLTPAYGSSTPFDATLVTNHSVTISGLQPTLTYYFRVLSVAGLTTNTATGSFTTTTLNVPLFTFSNTWKFTTNVVEPTWMLTDYDESAWEGEGISLFFIENNSDVFPRNTLLPGAASNAVLSIYYFRTHFSVSNPVAGLSLLFTNFIDDGAIFYLNGTEVKRVRMPAGPVQYSTLASECPPNGCDATFEAPDVFRIGGDGMTNLVVGDNVLAVEVHQAEFDDSDVVFGSSASLVRALASETRLNISRSNNAVCISWAGEFLTLQHASTLSGANPWTDVPGQIRNSPYCTTASGATRFYRLRN